MRTHYRILGSPGGVEHVILLADRRPWGVYLSIRTPWIFDRGVRLRLAVGPQYRWLHAKLLGLRRDRCPSCRAVVWNDSDRCERCLTPVHA
jgi:hypothetical protein